MNKSGSNKISIKKLFCLFLLCNSSLIFSTQPLITDLDKQPHPIAPGYMENGIAEVGANDSVPIELGFFGRSVTGSAGISLVFLIDDSGSLNDTDSNRNRFKAIKTLIDTYSATRNHLDRIAIVLFGGSDESLVQPWTTWEETANTLSNLESHNPDGETPMAAGMARANNLLIDETSFYKMCILLSDGYPFPDNSDNPQTETIVGELIPQARNNRILYSTVFLCRPDDPDNALLIDIARATDYINDNSIADPPRYYFRIEDSGNMVEAYEGLFTDLTGRLVPQDIRFSETINPRLYIDPQNPISFSGSGFSESMNIMDEPLDLCLDNFRESNTFKVRLNELDGQAFLNFNVKLDIETITPEELEAGYVLIEVDDLRNSMISYLNMVNSSCETIQISPLPQAKIRFNLGFQVAKSLADSGEGIIVKMTNLEPNDLNWVELAEFPNSYLNIEKVSHNFDFDPMGLIYRNYIIPWFIDEVLSNLPVRPSVFIENRIRRESASVLAQAHRSVLAVKNRLNQNLQRFGFHSVPHNALDRFWYSRYQHGVYLLDNEVPGKESVSIRIDVENAAELNSEGNSPSIFNGADATEMKGIEVLSKYRYEDMETWKLVSPNPPIYQIPQYHPKPDMYVETCFSESDLRFLGSFYKGSRVLDPWDILDSPDIKTFISHRNIRSEQGQIGVSVNVHNIGLSAGSCTVRVNAFFIPITGTESLSPFEPMQSFYSSGESVIESVESFSDSAVTVWMDGFSFLEDRERRSLTKDEFLAVQKAVVITVVTVESEDETFTGNNGAIEISRVYFKRF